MRLGIGCAVLVLVMIVPFNAGATPITYGIAGVFGVTVHPLLPPGTPYTALLTFDPMTFVTSSDPFGGIRYSSGSLAFSTGTVSLSGPISITIDSADDAIRIDQIGFLTGTFSAGLRINLVGAGLTSDAFPDPFPSLADFDVVRQFIINTQSSNIASITSFQPVPEPASIGLLSLGVGLLAASRRWTRRKRTSGIAQEVSGQHT